MHLRTTPAVMGCMLLLAASGGQAFAQNTAPFTIRFPPDGATVREKVPIRVPLASIPEGAYVAFSIDGQFRVALAPTSEQREKAKAGEMFEYVWDTKATVKNLRTNKDEAPADGEHTLTVALFLPKGGSAGGSNLTETSEVKVTLANKIPTDVGALALRYRFEDGVNRTYTRTGATTIVGGVTQGLGGTGDVDLIGQTSNLLLAVEDVYDNGRAIVRNRLTRLAVRQNGQETVYPADYLPKSIYQEVDPVGIVHYPPDRPTTDQFWQMGIPVSATLDMPILPSREVRIGDTWDTPGVVLDVPGTAPDKQPKVTVRSTLVGLEWEGKHQTARIHQTYSGALKEKQLLFGNILVDNPQVKLERDIYVAYRSGTLVKIDRTLEVSGTTSGAVSSFVGGAAGMTAGAPSAGAMAPGGMMMGGGMTLPGGMPGSPMTGMGAMAGIPGMARGRQGGMMPPGAEGTMGPGGMAGGPMMGGMATPPGMGAMTGLRGQRRAGRGTMAPGGMLGSGMGPMPGMRTGYRGGVGTGASYGAGQGQTSSKITLKSTSTTELSQPEPAPAK